MTGRRNVRLRCAFLSRDLLIERVNIGGRSEKEWQYFDILHLLEYQADRGREEQAMGSADKQGSIITSDHLDQIRGGQGNDRADSLARSSIFDQRLVDSLADLGCISVAQDQG